MVLPRGHYAGRRQVRDYLVRQAALDHLEVESVDETSRGTDGTRAAATTQVWRWRRSGGGVPPPLERRFTVREGRIPRIQVEHVA